LIQLYRANTNLEAQIRILQALGEIQNDAVETFLEDVRADLDTDSPRDARLGGVIFQIWAAHPTDALLPYLIYEGLFHDDPAVVRASAVGIAKLPEEARVTLSVGIAPAGRDPGDDLAVDMISRLMERPEMFHALEKVLVIWSGQPRPGY